MAGGGIWGLLGMSVIEGIGCMFVEHFSASSILKHIRNTLTILKRTSRQDAEKRDLIHKRDNFQGY